MAEHQVVIVAGKGFEVTVECLTCFQILHHTDEYECLPVTKLNELVAAHG